MVTVPIHMVGTAGVDPTEDPLMAPCIKCMIINPTTDERCFAFALLDSGAFPNAVSAKVAQTLDLPIVGADTIHTVQTTEDTNIHSGHLVVEGLPERFALDFQATAHHLNGHPYELILGRQFLTKFDFGFNRATGRWYLTHSDGL